MLARAHFPQTPCSKSDGSQLQRFDRPHRPARILFIDDDPHLHAVLQLRLQEFDVELEHAYFGSEGISKAISCCPDLIVTDMAMPRGDGSFAIETLANHSATSHIPIIVWSAMRDPQLRERALAFGASTYLQKPLKVSVVLEEIRRHVELGDN